MSNNILIAEQEECDVALVNGAKAFQYKDSDGNIQTVDLTSITNATSLFENNQNIGVDWEIDLSLLTSAGNMFKGSNIKSFKSDCSALLLGANMFNNCKELEHVEMLTNPTAKGQMNLGYFFKDCSSLKTVNLKRPNISNKNTLMLNISGFFENCTSLESVTVELGSHTSANFLNPSLKDMFKNCKSLKTINLSLTPIVKTTPDATGMFSGCLLGPEQLQQIVNWRWTNDGTYTITNNITIGVDSTKVSQEDIDNYWHSAILNKGFKATWEFNTPE